MLNLEVKNVAKPDETREFPKGHLDIVNLNGVVFGQLTAEPGWKWSECIKPIAGTDSCQVHHNGYVVQGRMRIRMDDGTEQDVSAGDVLVCPPGHDAWIVGDETCIMFDFSSQIQNYAK